MKVEWRTLGLASPGPDGYAPVSGPIAERISSEVGRLGKGRMPALVWILDRADARTNAILERNFEDEKLSIALERFLCLRADVSTLPDPRMREKMKGHVPVLLLFDAAGSPFSSLEGRRAKSHAALCSLVEKLWNRTFTLSLREYENRKDDVLDLLDQVERKKVALSAKLERADGNPAKRAALADEVEEVERLLMKIHENEERLKASLQLREEYLAGSEPESD